MILVILYYKIFKITEHVHRGDFWHFTGVLLDLLQSTTNRVTQTITLKNCCY